MLKAAIKSLLGHKLRMFLTGFSIILGVSFVAGTYIFTDSISSTFNNLFSDVFSGVDVSVRPKQEDFGGGNNTSSFDDSVLETVIRAEGVEIAEPSVAGFAQFIGKDGEPIGGQGPPTLGFSWTKEPSLNSLRINEGDGRPPEKAGEVIIDKGTAELNGFVVGDQVSVILAGPLEKFEIVGIATFGEADSFAGATIAAFELEEAQRVFNLEGKYSFIDVKGKDSISPEQLKQNIDSVLPEGIESITGEQQTNETLDQVGEALGFVNTALLAFAGIAVFVGSFIIQNTFRIIVAQRSKELALLRAIGATKVQVIRMVLYEALFISLLASGLGILLGFVIAGGVRAVMNSAGFSLPEGDLTLEPRTILVSLAVGVLVTLFSAVLPAIKASRVSPIEALRDNEASGASLKSLFGRGLTGILLVLVGAGSLIFGLNGEVDNPLYLVGLGVVMMFIGVAVIAPLLSKPLAEIIGWPLRKLRGVPARLATDNAKRSPRRTASTAAALMIGVSLVTMLSVLATTFKTQISTILQNSFPGDITISSNNIGEGGPGTAGFSVEAYNVISDLDELNEVSALRYKFEGAKIEDNIVFIAGIDPSTFNSVINIGVSEGALENFQDNEVIVSKKVAEENGWQIGQSLKTEFSITGNVPLVIAGTFEEAFDSDFLISNDTYIENIKNDDVTLIIANASDGIEVTTAKTAVEKALSDFPQLEVQDQEDLIEYAETQIDQILSLFWALLGFAVLIAVLGITNTLILSISERTKEIGMLRAIGMTRKQIRKMIRYESIIIALFGATLGICMGVFFGWAVLRALESEGITSFVIPYGQLAIYFFMAMIAGILAAAWPARKAARMNILKAIYHD